MNESLRRPKRDTEESITDLAGNVWQWCVDLFGEDEGSILVFRGGGWDSSAGFCAWNCPGRSMVLPSVIVNIEDIEHEIFRITFNEHQKECAVILVAGGRGGCSRMEE